MKKKVVISCGPIPARLDSVKFITNRFKGGLAFKTACLLKDDGYDLTIVKWSFTELPESLSDCKIVNASDVFEYYDWFEKHACDYDAFIMAAAVANLTPVNPYEGKFPSHNYQVGEKFNIEFQIAPRAIDIIKQKNKRCCLIGYKLFDAKTDEELIEIAKHTLKDSKANIIFANTPKNAKSRKIALFQDDTNFSVSFDEHVELIKRAIDQTYFKTETVQEPTDLKNKIELAKELVKKFETTISGYGTIAIKISNQGDFVTTSRGHFGEPVYVKEVKVDENKRGLIYSSRKATLNAPLLSRYIKDFDYVIHRHDEKDDVLNHTNQYIFPGTIEEYVLYDQLKGDKAVYELGHGYIKGYFTHHIDWERYFELFPEHYFKCNKKIEDLIAKYNKKDILEVGCNKKTSAGYFLDPNIKTIDGSKKITYEVLKEQKYKFKLIVLKNCINYLSEDELLLLKKSLVSGGEMIANTFLDNPEHRVKEYENHDIEGVYSDEQVIHHYLVKSEEEVYYHTFHKTNIEFLENLGFKLIKYGTNSVICYFQLK